MLPFFILPQHFASLYQLFFYALGSVCTFLSTSILSESSNSKACFWFILKFAPTGLLQTLPSYYLLNSTSTEGMECLLLQLVNLLFEEVYGLAVATLKTTSAGCLGF